MAKAFCAKNLGATVHVCLYKPPIILKFYSHIDERGDTFAVWANNNKQQIHATDYFLTTYFSKWTI